MEGVTTIINADDACLHCDAKRWGDDFVRDIRGMLTKTICRLIYKYSNVDVVDKLDMVIDCSDNKVKFEACGFAVDHEGKHYYIVKGVYKKHRYFRITSIKKVAE